MHGNPNIKFNTGMKYTECKSLKNAIDRQIMDSVWLQILLKKPQWKNKCSKVTLSRRHTEFVLIVEHRYGKEWQKPNKTTAYVKVHNLKTGTVPLISKHCIGTVARNVYAFIPTVARIYNCAM